MGIQLTIGQAVRLESPGGGGYGEPLLRTMEAVSEDVRLGYISPNAARSEYGVVVDLEGKIDFIATKKIRDQNSKIEATS